MIFSVIIATRNRCEDLRRTLQRLREMEPAPSEVVVCADGCTDATTEVVRVEYSNARLIVHDAGVGSVGSRHELLGIATSDWVLSLDDDSYPVDIDFFARANQIIAAHPEAMVITFPELRDGGVFSTPDRTSSAPAHYVSAYPNCAALMNRAFYLRQPGFPRIFFHMYEEPDYALQCYAAGAAVWFEPSLTIRHHLSPHNRNNLKRHHQNARNELWSVWMRCPWPWVPLVSIFRVFRQFRYSCSEGWSWAIREPIWWWSAALGANACRYNRQPVPWSKYFRWMKLARKPIATKIDLKHAFGISAE